MTDATRNRWYLGAALAAINLPWVCAISYSTVRDIGLPLVAHDLFTFGGTLLGFETLIAYLVFAAIASAIAVYLFLDADARARTRGFSGTRVSAPPESVRREALIRLSQLRNVSTPLPNDGRSLMVTRQHYPGWSIFVAVAFFPLGMLALLARRTESVTLLLSEIAPPPQSITEIQVAGVLTRPMLRALERPPLAPTATGEMSSHASMSSNNAGLPQPDWGVAPQGSPSPTPTLNQASPGAHAPIALAGWFPDPYGRYEQRYWDGASWTDSVLVDGVSILEPAIED